MDTLRTVVKNRWFRWLAPLALVILALFLFRDQLSFIGQAVEELRNADPGPILLAMGTSLLSLVAMGEVMRLLMLAGGRRVSPVETTALTLASNSWSTTMPGGPAFSAVLTFQVQRRWGASILLCGWFFVMSSALSTMWLVVIGVAAVLFLGADVSVWSLLLSLAVMLALAAFVYWLTNHPSQIERWTRAAAPRINKLLRRDPNAGTEAIIEQVRQLDTVHISAGRFVAAATHSLGNRLFDVLTLWFSVWAVTGALPWLSAGENETTLMGVMLAYITAKLAGSAQVTPAGLGTVEAAIIATLVATGMTAVDATGAAIVYRVISFAFITVIGWIVYFLHYARDGFSGPRQLQEQTHVDSNKSLS